MLLVIPVLYVYVHMSKCEWKNCALFCVELSLLSYNFNLFNFQFSPLEVLYIVHTVELGYFELSGETNHSFK